MINSRNSKPGPSKRTCRGVDLPDHLGFIERKSGAKIETRNPNVLPPVRHSGLTIICAPFIVSRFYLPVEMVGDQNWLRCTNRVHNRINEKSNTPHVRLTCNIPLKIVEANENTATFNLSSTETGLTINIEKSPPRRSPRSHIIRVFTGQRA